MSESKFKEGDIVRCLDTVAPHLTAGKDYAVTKEYDGFLWVIGNIHAETVCWLHSRFKLAEETPKKPPALQSSGAALLTQVGGTHYTDMAIQPIEYILANNIPFPEGNVIKYVSRWRSKGGLKDVRKAVHHLQLLIEHEEGLGTA
jgi:hypothetical protein